MAGNVSEIKKLLNMIAKGKNSKETSVLSEDAKKEKLNLKDKV